MTKALVLVGLACLGSFSPAQQPDPKRLTEIWNAAGERFSRQNDAWFADGDFPRTVQLLRFHAAFTPNDYEVVTNLGYMLENIEEWDEALVVYIQFRNTNPSDRDSSWPEANFYYQKKAYAKVPPLLEPIIRNRDPHPNNYRTLAHAYEKLEMFADAKRVWEAYLAKYPDDVAAKVNLAKMTKKLSGAAPR